MAKQPQFKLGDRIVANKSTSPYFTEGCIYEVKSHASYFIDNKEVIKILDDTYRIVDVYARDFNKIGG
jgi:hypothetical protein